MNAALLIQETREAGLRMVRADRTHDLRHIIYSHGAKSLSTCSMEQLSHIYRDIKRAEGSVPTFAQLKATSSYQRVAVIVQDTELGCSRVGAYFPNLHSAIDECVKSKEFLRATIYVRYDAPIEPIAGDYQI